MNVKERRARLWMLSVEGSRHVFAVPGIGRFIARVSDRQFARRFIPDLLRMHDVLEGTELAGRYWVWAGMLLGWAREGGLLAHDRDADLALLPEDLPKLLAAVPALRRAGFHPLHMFRNNEGNITEVTFCRHTAKFEFFVMEPVDDMLRYYVYGYPPDHLIEVEAQVPNQELVPFEFLGRTWLRHADYEGELKSMYGDWRTPHRGWDYLQDDQAQVSRRAWVNTNISWSG